MKTFGTIKSSDHTIEKYSAYADLSWRLISSSYGVNISYPEDVPELSGSVTMNRANVHPETETVNIDSGINEYVLYRSIKHLFYDRSLTLSPSDIPFHSFVVSIGQNLYGDRIKPGTFEISHASLPKSVIDDAQGNLIVDTTTVGHIFYDRGIAVIKHNTGSAVLDISTNGLQFVSGNEINLDYDSDTEFEQHEINIRIKPNEFNFTAFNPTLKTIYSSTGSVTASFDELNIPQTSSNAWVIRDLMSAEVIKPYITSIGLYNEQYELLAVAKLATPIQRTFDTDQIFIVRFDTE